MSSKDKAAHSLYWYGDLREVENDPTVTAQDVEDAKEYMRYWHGEEFDK